VTAPVFLVDTSLLHPGRVVLDGPEGHHAADVRRLRVGEQVHLADGAGRVGHGSVAQVRRGLLEVDVDRVVVQPRPQPRLLVVQALVKQDAAEQAVTSMTEVGVDEIVPWAAQRSVVSWTGERTERGLRRWQASATEAAKQSRRAWVPSVRTMQTTAEVTRLVVEADLALVLEVDGDHALATVELPEQGTIVVVVGPEGGLTPRETAGFGEAGAVTAHLGPTVLRSATAGTVAASVLLSRTRRWAHAAG
jgi:16S rRNA (uracil1498-N3)-methyltransferase